MPWRRLAWILPAALAMTALEVTAFIYGFARMPAPEPVVIAVRLIELPAEPPLSIPTRPAETVPEPPAIDTQPSPPAPAQPPPPSAAAEPPPTRIESQSAPAPPRLSRSPIAKPSHPTRPRAPIHPREIPQRAPATPTLDLTPSSAAEPSVAAPSAARTQGGGTMGARAIYRPMPDIPEELRRRALNLVAVARFHVAADGRAEVELTAATPDPRLNRVIVEALGKWRFVPAMADGKPIASTLEIRIPIEVQ